VRKNMRKFRHLLPALFAFLMLASPLQSRAAVDVALTVTVAPPPLPIYAQPVIPDEGYMWMPGYWAWGQHGYYWVPGTWVLPPQVGFLWTPGYWAWRDGVYVWHAGYWGPTVGYYGGINYGFGYTGVGYVGGFWDHDHFRYNAAANNFGGKHITNVYRQTIVHNTTRVSFNGGRGGIAAQPGAAEQAAEREQHVPPTDLQTRHEQSAGANRTLLSSVNHGRPAIAATPHPAAFTEHGTVAARGANAPQGHPTHQAKVSHPGPAHNQGQAKPPQHQAQRPPNDQRPDDHQPDHH
jgi:hypothetical protein